VAELERVVTTDPHSPPESLTVVPDGVLYANNVISNTLYRIPLHAYGKAGAPKQI
jgi:hypothetical protein